MLQRRVAGTAPTRRCGVPLALRVPKRRVVARAAPPDDRDLVTRWVGKIFGEAAVNDPEPGGLKRVDWSKVKDLEVTMDREADPIASDDSFMKLFRPLMAGTQLETEDLRLAYSATEDGWSPGAFHAGVDGYGPTVVLARTTGGAVCGGYNPLGFDGYGSDKSTMGSFLFTFPDGDTKGGAKAFKLPKVETDQLAVVDRMDQGPQFGPGDLKILLKQGAATKVTSKLIDYKRPPGGSKTLFNPATERTTTTELVELRCYVRKGGKLKYTLDGLRWKSEFTDNETGEGPPPGVVTM
ncbi:hypothetical protein FOA52_010260 [Chlamydomonas sp. UWO 241]|nr:hypothetical protein FOA52_010260 [Chlamydomonas sp. UWO 241]